ncbi:MAG: hypothetical protein GF353_28370 [Candidatus Lokiarchaeota archaeon]|nr:hypothetical protein [Candidatus Lokiarchaeota archaeon]
MMQLINSSIVYKIKKNYFTNFVLSSIRDKIKKDIAKPKDNLRISLTLPVFIEYSEGYSLQFFPDRLIIEATYPDQIELEKIDAPPDSLLQTAQNFIEDVLPLECTAIGLNFKVWIPEKSIAATVIQSDKDIISMKYTMKRKDYIIINNVNKASIESENKTKSEGLLFDSNFHFEIEKENTKKYINNILIKRKECLNDLRGLLNELTIS